MNVFLIIMSFFRGLFASFTKKSAEERAGRDEQRIKEMEKREKEINEAREIERRIRESNSKKEEFNEVRPGDDLFR